MERITDEIWKDFDTDNNGWLAKDEAFDFLRAALRAGRFCDPDDEAILRKLYGMIDKNNDGVIVKNEFITYLKEWS